MYKKFVKTYIFIAFLDFQKSIDGKEKKFNTFLTEIGHER